jgi:hypothetical protein
MGAFKFAKRSAGSLIKATMLVLAGLFSVTLAAQAQVSELKIISEVTEAGIKETRFDIDVDGVTVPGILWTPEGAQGTCQSGR